MPQYMRVKQAAEYLEVSPNTIRVWTNNGTLKTHRNVSNQRIFYKEELDAFIRERKGEPEPERNEKHIFYIRSSSGNDVSLDTQREALEESYGEPFKVFQDKSSGLNENRAGLKSMLAFVKDNDNCVVCVTNKDRLTRFGFSYLEQLVASYGGSVEVLNDSETKEPFEVLMEDFMALVASFSGKFYRLRGWEQQRKLIGTVSSRLKDK